MIVAWPSYPCNCNFIFNCRVVVVNKEVWHTPCSSIVDWNYYWHGWPSGIISFSLFVVLFLWLEYGSPLHVISLSRSVWFTYSLYTVYYSKGIRCVLSIVIAGHTGDIYTSVVCACCAWHRTSSWGIDSLHTYDPSQSHCEEAITIPS